MDVLFDDILLDGDQDDEDIEHLEIGHVEGCAGDAVGDEAHPNGSRQVVDPFEFRHRRSLSDKPAAGPPGPEKDGKKDPQADKARIAQDLEVDAVGGMGSDRIGRWCWDEAQEIETAGVVDPDV